MLDRRLIDSYCTTCQDVRLHLVRPSDPGSCACTRCGATQQLVVPIS